MDVSVLQEEFHAGLNLIRNAAARRTTLPVLSGILVSTQGGQLQLTASDLEIAMSCTVASKVNEEGSIVLPNRLLSDLISALPPERIDMTLDSTTLTVTLKCGRFETSIKGMDAEDFPTMGRRIEMQTALTLDAALFKSMVHHVVFAASKDQSRPAFHGALFELENSCLTMVAVDGFRMSVKVASIGEAEPFSVIIPYRALAEMARMKSEEGEAARLIVTDRQAIYKTNEVKLVSSLIEGEFIEYQRNIPEAHNTRAVVATAALLKVAKVSQLFSRYGSNIVELEMTPGAEGGEFGSIALSGESTEYGGAEAEVPATVTGEPMTVGLNGNYLVDLLSTVDSPQVEIQTTSPASPVLFRLPGDDTFWHVIMPIHIKEAAEK